MLLPGAFYAECAAVKLSVKITPEMREQDLEYRKAVSRERAAAKASKGKGKATDEPSSEPEAIDIPDDGEYGGELAGRLAWEAYEEALKIWEQENPGLVDEVKDTLQPSVASPQPRLPKVEEENPNVY